MAITQEVHAQLNTWMLCLQVLCSDKDLPLPYHFHTCWYKPENDYLPKSFSEAGPSITDILQTTWMLFAFPGISCMNTMVLCGIHGLAWGPYLDNYLMFLGKFILYLDSDHYIGVSRL